MSYYINQDTTSFYIPSSEVAGAYVALKEFISSCGDIPWVDIGECLESDSLEEMLQGLRWETVADADGNIIDIKFIGEKMGFEEDIFSALSRFVKEGSFIDLAGWDDYIWKVTFKNGNCMMKKIKKKKPKISKYPKLPRFERKYFISLRSNDLRFGNGRFLYSVLHDVLKKKNMEFIGRLNIDNNAITPVPEGGFNMFLDKYAKSSATFVVSRTPSITLNICQMPIELFIARDSLRANSIFVSIADPYSWDEAKQLFIDFSTALNPAWGELSDINTTGEISFWNMNAAYHMLPRLSTANFIGPGFYEYLGGIDAISKVGFSECIEMEHGCYVEVGRVNSKDEFINKKTQLEYALAPREFYLAYGEKKPDFYKWRGE